MSKFLSMEGKLARSMDKTIAENQFPVKEATIRPRLKMAIKIAVVSTVHLITNTVL
jgi:hypothetical protein